MDADELNPGLEGVVVAETRLSRVDGEAGELVIAGFPLEELAPNATFEETVYLLRNDRLPNAEELEAFCAELASYRELPDATLDLLRAAAAVDVGAMDALRMGVATLSLVGESEDEDHERDSLALVAAMPTIVAAYWRLQAGEELVEPREDLSHATNYLHMLDGEEPSDERVRGLETYLNAVVDHGLNASTFTARAIVSTESDVISAVTGAVGSLKGPLHGGAPGPVLDMLHAVGEPANAEEYLAQRLEAGERLMGFGHRVYRVRDPRAAVLSAAAERFYTGSGGGEEAFFELARAVEETGVDLLAERRPDRRLATNVEFYTAVLLRGIGVPRELFTPTFAVARVGGWTAHCLEQRANNRIVRPRGRYVGETGREWVPVDRR